MQDDLFTAAVAEPDNPGVANFHPLLERWFADNVGQPTSIQSRAWPLVQQKQNVLVAAPTGSGKTLAAFLAAINDLTERSIHQPLADQVYVLYVSPLKALSNDIEQNLQWPLARIRQSLDAQGIAGGAIRCAVRTGDTAPAERQRMKKFPPHILVTTPESLFILLTSESGRAMLAGVETAIIDEVHSMAGNKRGAHLALSLARLDALVGQPVVRIGLSATQQPIALTAKFLVGTDQPCAIVDEGHIRDRDIALELPESPLDAVMSNEVWGELYDRLAALVREHRQTLIFVNTRRLAERLARHLEERVGEDKVMAHHGSLSREHRLRAETRLRSGDLPVLVATASLELGIDIGDIDLVCQMGSPRSISAFLQRVGRSGHGVHALPKGRLFPLALDDLVECAALVDAVHRGELDQLSLPLPALDVLAQQLVAECASRDWQTDDLYARIKQAAPFESLSRESFDAVLTMLSRGVATTHGRRGAHLHFDAVNGQVRGRRGARLAAMTQAGVIPDQFDYDVVLMPDGHRIGTLNEDFAFESLPGDIFQLGNTEYQVLKVETSRVLVQDAAGQPPTIPFWFGEAPGRTDALSFAVSRLRQTAAEKLSISVADCESWARQTLNLSDNAAAQLTEYLAAAHAALGDLPTLNNLILERFFDDAGDTHLVLHSSWGSRVNRAFGLALRKRFCRQFNFELQASALEDSLILSLGPTHSFPLETVAEFLRSHSVRKVLIQALLDAPMFPTRWRWNATIALAVQRMRAGTKMPPPIQRAQAEDLMAVVFPDQLACQENLSGEREVPDHPLVDQTIRDCLHDTMDVDGLQRLVQKIEQNKIRLIACDLTGPSPLSAPIINARPYAFLDDGDAEARRTRAISSPMPTDLAAATELALITVDAIEQVVNEIRPEPRDVDELHDVLMTSGYLQENELADADLLAQLQKAGRCLTVVPDQAAKALWFATERADEFRLLYPDQDIPEVTTSWAESPEDAVNALQAVVSSRLEITGPITAPQLSESLGLPEEKVTACLAALEGSGAIIQGKFHPAATEIQWCDRRLLQRIHRYSTRQRRNAVKAVSPSAFMRFLLHWHQISDDRRQGEEGLVSALGQLEGFPVAASAWAGDLLRPRISGYQVSQLDALCLAGRQLWLPALSKQPSEARSAVVGSTAIIFCPREHRRQWLSAQSSAEKMGSRAQRVLAFFQQRGALFFDDLVEELSLPATEVEKALLELVANAWLSADSFSALNHLIKPASKSRRRRRPVMQQPGRWALLGAANQAREGRWPEADVELRARVLLRRYGVVFRALLRRETGMPPWRDLLYSLRRLEARGEIRGGRFVSGFSGEQFALADAARQLSGFKEERDTHDSALVVLSACDPLNLSGVLPGTERIPAVAGHQILMRGHEIVAVQDAQGYRSMVSTTEEETWQYQSLMLRKRASTALMSETNRPH